MSKYLPYVASFVAGGGLLRVMNYIAKALPQLPANAGWWKQFGYNLVEQITSIDPNSVSLKRSANGSGSPGAH
jgi:hypothetical protein